MPSRVALRIFSTSRSASAITRALGLEPSHAHDRGSPRIPEHPEGRTFQSTGWFREAGRGAWAAQLEEVLALAEPRKTIFEALGQDAQIDLSCGLFAQQGLETFVLGAALVARLAVLGLPLVLALHPQPAPKHAVHGASLFDAARWNRKWRGAASVARDGRRESGLDASLPLEAHVARLLREPPPHEATLELTCAAANGQDRATLGAEALLQIAEKSGQIVIVLAPSPMGGASA